MNKPLPPHPIQPLVKDEHGTLRFRKNAIVTHLLETHQKADMNSIAMLNFSNEDRQQFAQLIGYSLDGYGELSSYVDDDAYNAAVASIKKDVRDAKIATLTAELNRLRRALQKPMARLFGVHPEDLNRNIK